MKRIWWLLVIVVLLCGCSGEQVLETVNDELLINTGAPLKQITVKLPSDASRSVLAAEDGSELYFCDGYILTLQTSPAGDLDQTVRRLCGYSRDRLTVMETRQGGVKRYDWTWSSAGEGGAQVGRAAVLDDGDHHYCMTVMADEAGCGKLDARWDSLFTSLSLKH